MLEIGPDHRLTPEIVSVFSHNPAIKIKLSRRAKEGILASRKAVEKMVATDQVVYGITTGFGNFKNKTISQSDTEELQKNLIRSHAVGVGEPFSPEQVRAIMLVRLNSLVQGYSGVRMEFLETFIKIIEKNIIPFVPSQGSVGSSGDLAPLSHIGLVLMGEGRVFVDGKLVEASLALKNAGIVPIVYGAKEGLAFNNGTAAMTGVAALSFVRAKNLLNIADVGCALTLEAVCGVSSAFDLRIHDVRPHSGQRQSATNIRKLIKGSSLVDSVSDRVQDSYSLRCTPQVHGAVRDAVSYVESVINVELNSVTDNPIIFEKDEIAISGGNFHGEPIAIAMDTLGIAISELANISERRTAKLLDPSTNEGLPAFLVDKTRAGLHSGLMIPQYTSAALVSENKVLAHPASVDSVPTSANQEDHVSMGTIAARKSVKIVENTEYVLAIEFMTACQAIDFRDSKKLARHTKSIYDTLRKSVKSVDGDREMHADIVKIRELIQLGVDIK